MMTGDDGRDGRLMYLAFFFLGGYDGVDDGSWGRSFIVDYLQVFERFFICCMFLVGLQKETTHFPKFFFVGPIFWVSLFFDDTLEDMTFWK